MELYTIQKREKLNRIYALDEMGPGGAYHKYSIVGENVDFSAIIVFQKGPRKDPNSQRGVLDCDLLEIVRHRLHCFQMGEFACRENAMALMHIEDALYWMNRRVEDRIERQVLGTYNK